MGCTLLGRREKGFFSLLTPFEPLAIAPFDVILLTIIDFWGKRFDILDVKLLDKFSKTNLGRIFKVEYEDLKELLKAPDMFKLILAAGEIADIRGTRILVRKDVQRNMVQVGRVY